MKTQLPPFPPVSVPDRARRGSFWIDAFPEDVTGANVRLIEASPKLLDLLARALPFVEDAETDPAYKPGIVRKFAKEIRDAIESL